MAGTEVDITAYQAHHGGKPMGNKRWVFQLKGNPRHKFVVTNTYGQARRLLRAYVYRNELGRKWKLLP